MGHSWRAVVAAPSLDMGSSCVWPGEEIYVGKVFGGNNSSDYLLRGESVAVVEELRNGSQRRCESIQ